MSVRKSIGILCALVSVTAFCLVFRYLRDNRQGNFTRQTDLYVYPATTASQALEQVDSVARHPRALRRVFRRKRVAEFIKPGHYTVDESTSSVALARMLNNGWQTPVSLTLSGTLRLRDELAPTAKVSVLSNATRVHLPEVFRALSKVDNPIMKIDAPTNALIEKVNKPAPGYDIARVVEALEQFQGNFVLQTCMLRSKEYDFDSSRPEVLDGWMDIVRRLRPREIMVYTIDRPTPAQGLEKFTVEEMTAFVQPLIDEGFRLQIKG